MPYRSYTLEYKIKMIVKYKLQNCSTRQFCRDENIPRTTFLFWIDNYEKEQLVNSRKKTGRPKIINQSLINYVKALVDSNPFIFMKDVVSKCKTKGFTVSLTTVYRMLKIYLGYTRKRAKYVSVGKMSIPEVLTKIADKQAILQSNGIDTYVSIDEMAVYETMYQEYGWAPKGCVLQARQHALKSKRHTLLLAISTKGVMSYKLYDGSVNNTLFYSFLKNGVMPKMSTQTTILMDNVRFHHSRNIKDLVTNKGYSIEYTVPYTPELNPVENAFSISKRHIKHLNPTSKIDLYNAVNKSLSLVTPEKCKNMFMKSFGLTDYKITRI